MVRPEPPRKGRRLKERPGRADRAPPGVRGDCGIHLPREIPVENVEIPEDEEHPRDPPPEGDGQPVAGGGRVEDREPAGGIGVGGKDVRVEPEGGRRQEPPRKRNDPFTIPIVSCGKR